MSLRYLMIKQTLYDKKCNVKQNPANQKLDHAFVLAAIPYEGDLRHYQELAQSHHQTWKSLSPFTRVDPGGVAFVAYFDFCGLL